jgi:Sec7-like guanine-nucleotide exchange factor
LIGSANHIDVLRQFVGLFDFRNVGFGQAFRAFLHKFQTPGEVHMIDRVMEQFGTKYYIANPTRVFPCVDPVYVLSFATLMLHTDAYHPLVKKRTTLEQFLQNINGQYS